MRKQDSKCPESHPRGEIAVTRRYQPLHQPVGVTLQDVLDELDEQLWDCHWEGALDEVFFGLRVWSGGEAPRPGILYVLPTDGTGFPTRRASYVCVGEVRGTAPHICIPGRRVSELLDLLAGLFERFRDLEADLNWLLGHGGGLDELCRVAGDFFQNPVYIHDSMFTLLAQSHRVEGMLELGYNEKTGKYFVPLWLIEDFKFSEGYAETLQRHEPAIWGADQCPYHMRSLYVNIWDVDYYRARILIDELHVLLRPGDLRVAGILGDYALQLLLRDDRAGHPGPRNYEDTVKSLLSGSAVDPMELQVLLTSLGWSETDPYLLVKLQSQDDALPLSSYSVLRSSLSTVFPGSFSVLYEQRLCMVVDLRAAQATPSDVRSQLAPFLRDSLLYAGASQQVGGIQELAAASEQAGAALACAFRLRGAQWYVPFSDCALHYLLSHVRTPFPLRLMLSPALEVLRRHDAAHGSQYYETLRCYLRNERSVPRTAAALIIHRTTLLYRIEKIVALTGLDLDSAAVRLYLILSFQLSEEPSRSSR